MDSFRDALDRIAAQHKTITVYGSVVHPELVEQFGGRNATVVHRPLPPGYDRGFVVVTEREEFLGSMSLDALDALTTPPIVSPWDREVGLGRLYELLDSTLFASFDRRQMLATAREIEDRAWRTASGTLYTGFQRPDALATQTGVYTRLATRPGLDIHLFVQADWPPPEVPGVTVHALSAGEIGRYWFLLFDGGGEDDLKCGLVAEERSRGSYYGFWTYEPDMVDELLAYVREVYVEGGVPSR